MTTAQMFLILFLSGTFPLAVISLAMLMVWIVDRF